jgi:oligopeptide/dipeptide ABC transporter ATP-binding protein
MSDFEGPLLQVRSLRVEFRPQDSAPALAVENLSFELRHGEGLAVLGESGSGKTAAALAIAGLLPGYARAEGEVLLDGRELLSMEERRMRRRRGGAIGFVFQEPSAALDPVIPIGEQVAEAARAHGKDAKLARHNAMAALGSAGFPEPDRRWAQYPHELSGGLRQRACIAAAIVNRPALLVADEPTRALDVSVQAGIIELLCELRRGFDMAMIFITHDVSLAPHVADRALVLYAGQPVEIAMARELLDRPLHPYTQALLASAPRLGTGRGRLAETAGSVPSAAERLPGCRFAPRCHYVADACRREAPRLVEVVPGHLVSCHRPAGHGAAVEPLPEIRL